MIYYLTDRTLERAIERCSNDNYNYLIVLKDNKDFDETSVSILEQAMMNEILVDELVEDSKWEILAKHTNSHGSYKEKYKSKEELSFA